MRSRKGQSTDGNPREKPRLLRLWLAPEALGLAPEASCVIAGGRAPETTHKVGVLLARTPGRRYRLEGVRDLR